jgi:iron-sulfur cluster insertion protein
MENFIVTSNAADRVSYLVSQESKPIKGLRISVLGGGCSGFQYKYELEESVADDDIIFTVNQANVFIDKMSLDLIQGSTLDYVEDLGSAGFEIKNPKATAKCGCGNSFAL